MRFFHPFFASALALCVFGRISLEAQTYTWNQTAASTTLNWNTPGNWTPSGFPNVAGDVANVNNNIAGAQTIRLQQGIALGILNLGDSDGSHAFTISSGTGTNTLTFNSGSPGVAAQLNVENNGTVTHTISAPIVLASNLNITLKASTLSTNSARLTLSGPVDLGSRTLTLSGGYVGASDVNQFNMSGTLTGSGTIINNGDTPFQFGSGGKAGFTGTLIANGAGGGGSNTGTFAIDSSTSLANATEMILNGALTAGSTQLGGSIHSGASSNATSNPSQRFTSNTMTFNGGTLRAHGWLNPGVLPADVGTGTGTDTAWRRGEEAIQDIIATMNINSGYSRIEIAVNGTTTAGTILTATHLNRSQGASLLVSHQNGTQILGSAVVEDSPRFFIGNANDFLIGGTGSTATTQKIIPWIGVTGVGGSAGTIGNSAGFSTYGANGLRLLDVATEYSTSLTAGPTENVNVSSVAIPGTNASATVNSLRYTGTSTNIGSGNTLTVTSGGVFFLNNNAAIGASGNAAAGTLNFGSAEGVIWSNASNTNIVGASISGSLGVSKAGTGTLILTGHNTYSGLTYVGSGTLQVGDGGSNTSNLGLTGDVTVSNGATLSLLNDDAIADGAIIRLQQFGLLNGKMNLGAGVDETVGALFFGDTQQLAGTWGSTLSGATHQDDTYFSGTGILIVVPEPGCATLLLSGIAATLGFRRRRS